MLCAAMVLAGMALGYGQTSVVDGVTFADESDVLFVPIKEVGYAMGWEMRSEGSHFFVGDREVSIPRTLIDGTRLIPVANLVHLGLTVTPSENREEFTIEGDGKQFVVRRGEKRVVINKGTQRLRGYQGDRIVIDTHVSTGRRGFTTPSGNFTAGPEKARLRHSRKYENAPMPWSVQITGGYFMHGYPSVPKHAASHGCVRLPLRGANPARWIWNWIDLGTPITIGNDWGDVEVAQEKSTKTTRDTVSTGTSSETIPIPSKGKG